MRVLIYSPRRLYGESLGASLEQTGCVAAIFVEHDWTCVPQQVEKNAADIVLADVVGTPAALTLRQLDEVPVGVPVVALVTDQPLPELPARSPEISGHVHYNADADTIAATMRASLMQVTEGEATVGGPVAVQDQPKKKTAKRNARNILILWAAFTALALGFCLNSNPAV